MFVGGGGVGENGCDSINKECQTSLFNFIFTINCMSATVQVHINVEFSKYHNFHNYRSRQHINLIQLVTSHHNHGYHFSKITSSSLSISFVLT